MSNNQQEATANIQQQEFVSDNVRDLQLQIQQLNAENTRLNHTIDSLVSNRRKSAGTTSGVGVSANPALDDLNWKNRVLRDENVDLAKRLSEAKKENRSLQLVIYRGERSAAAKREKDDATIAQNELNAVKLQYRDALNEIKAMKKTVSAYEKRELKLRTALPDLYKQLLQMGAIAADTEDNSSATSSDQDIEQITDLVLRAISDANRRAEAAERMVERSKTAAGGKENHLKEILATVDQLKKANLSLKLELKNAKDQTKDLEEQLITFASEYEYLSREYQEREKALETFSITTNSGNNTAKINTSSSNTASVSRMAAYSSTPTVDFSDRVAMAQTVINQTVKNSSSNDDNNDNGTVNNKDNTEHPLAVSGANMNNDEHEQQQSVSISNDENDVDNVEAVAASEQPLENCDLNNYLNPEDQKKENELENRIDEDVEINTEAVTEQVQEQEIAADENQINEEEAENFQNEHNEEEDCAVDNDQ